jgi:hypothetical protein
MNCSGFQASCHNIFRNQCLLRHGRDNAWVGILGGHLLGPVFLANRLTGALYHRCLVNDFLVPLEHAPLHQRQHLYLMRDVAPPHFLIIVRQHLNQICGEQWIGRGGPVNWPTRSPDPNLSF